MTPARAAVVVAHPDDEAWLFGGTLARWAEEGAELTVLCVTDGAAGRDASGERRGEELAELRRAELDASCATLGVARVLRLGLPDGGLAAFPVERGRALIREALQPLHCQRVLTHGKAGDYGHLDHLAVAEWVRGSGEVWHAAPPAALMQPIWRRLRKVGFRGLRAGMQPQDFERREDEQVALAPRHCARRAEAVGCHRSQLPGGALDRFLAPGLLGALPPHESYERGS